MPTAQTPDSGAPVPGVQGRHYQHIKAAIPQSLIHATPALRASVRQVKPAIPDWYAAAAPAQKSQLQTLLDASIRSHAALAQSMDKIQDVNDFARPLLAAALTAAGFPLDVDQTCLRLYVPTEDTFGVGSGGFKTKTFSLLQAALNNFEAPETRAGFFDSASGFITAPDANGHFERFNTTLKIEVFATLCRELDLGQQYQAHLTTFLRPTETVAQNLLRERYITRRKDAFKAAAYLALLKHDIVPGRLRVSAAGGPRRAHNHARCQAALVWPAFPAAPSFAGLPDHRPVCVPALFKLVYRLHPR